MLRPRLGGKGFGGGALALRHGDRRRGLPAAEVRERDVGVQVEGGHVPVREAAGEA